MGDALRGAAGLGGFHARWWVWLLVGLWVGGYALRRLHEFGYVATLRRVFRRGGGEGG